ncbi:hypothetical protein ACTMTF_15245 [Nonomuraea sp. ZG12]|uniref:hypothetical protein n=1 Tax=Nonomuraea sp. ZG12 TaxID=3452207 RepID=UPI003F8A2702
MIKRLKARLADKALALVLNRIQAVAYTDQWGGVFNCLTCGEMVYGIDEGDYLECIAARSFDHKCKESK